MKAKVTERWTEKVHVVMEWDIDAEMETTESPGVRCVGWLSNYGAVLANCTYHNAVSVSVARGGQNNV